MPDWFYATVMVATLFATAGPALVELVKAFAETRELHRELLETQIETGRPLNYR